MSLRALLVEDEPDIQLIARAALKRAGFDVTIAGDGLQALAAVAGASFDVIVMDCNLPALDGFAACARLKENPATRSIAVVFLTAKADASAHERCLALGAVGCIAKPFNPLRLGDQVKTLLTASGVTDASR
jgi:two-component system, OmpR family, response regulator